MVHCHGHLSPAATGSPLPRALLSSGTAPAVLLLVLPCTHSSDRFLAQNSSSQHMARVLSLVEAGYRLPVPSKQRELSWEQPGHRRRCWHRSGCSQWCCSGKGSYLCRTLSSVHAVCVSAVSQLFIVNHLSQKVPCTSVRSSSLSCLFPPGLTLLLAPGSGHLGKLGCRRNISVRKESRDDFLQGPRHLIFPSAGGSHRGLEFILCLAGAACPSQQCAAVC